jgi:putative N-acetyltransferase (TIGR04045 family)
MGAERVGAVLLGRSAGPRSRWSIAPAADGAEVIAYRQLRRRVFVQEQGLFAGSDADAVDEDPRTVVLVARSVEGTILGGVRLAPVRDPDIGWWHGGRLAVEADARSAGGIGAALVRAACAHAEAVGALRFEATVQAANERWFAHLGWRAVRTIAMAGAPHVLMYWPIDRSGHARGGPRPRRDP